MKRLSLIVLLGGASLLAAEPGSGWLGAPGAAESALEKAGKPAATTEPGAVAPGQDGPALAARRVLDVMRRWPGPHMTYGRRLELVWAVHDLEQKGSPRAAGIVRRYLRRYERSHCDRRDPDQEAASTHLTPAEVGELREHLDVHHRARFSRGRVLPEGFRALDLIRSVPICHYRM